MTDIKQLLKEFESFAYGQSLHSAFTEILDWTLLPFKRYEDELEQEAALKKYRNHPRIAELVKMVTLIGELSEGFSDPLGELFMQSISNGHNGQYFTPEPICDMMVKISIGKPTDGQTVADCACGSGRMLPSAAKINRNLRLYGADLDITCCKMALINMLLNSLQGEITHMNSLSNDFYRGYKVCTKLVDTHYVPYFIEFTEPEQSYIWLQPVKDSPKSKFYKPHWPLKVINPFGGTQGSLF